MYQSDIFLICPFSLPSPYFLPTFSLPAPYMLLLFSCLMERRWKVRNMYKPGKKICLGGGGECP